LQVNFYQSRPIYEQIIDEIKKMLVRKELQPGDQLPSQRELAQQINVNPNTIQRAYREMEITGLAESRRGLGTFIISEQDLIKDLKEEMAQLATQNFISEMKSLGFEAAEIEKWVKQNQGINEKKTPGGEGNE